MERATLYPRIVARPSAEEIAKRLADVRTGAAGAAATHSRCPTCGRFIIADTHSGPRIRTSGPIPDDKCALCALVPCDVCGGRSSPGCVQIIGPRSWQTPRPEYIAPDVQMLHLCDACDAQPIPATQHERADRQIAAQRATMREMRSRSGGTGR